MAYDVIDKVYSIIIDTMTGVCSGNGKATFYNTDSNTSFLEITVTNGVLKFDMTKYSYILAVSKPKGTTYKNKYNCTDPNKLLIKMDSDMLSGVGTNKAQLYIMDNANKKILTMVEFNYIVKAGNYDALAPESENHDALYIEIKKSLDNLVKVSSGVVDLDVYQTKEDTLNEITKLQVQLDALKEKVNLDDNVTGGGGSSTDYSAEIEALSNRLTTLEAIVNNLDTSITLPELADVATSGDYYDLINKPTALSDFVNDLELSGSDIELPIASSTILGGIKVGDGLSISDTGVLSAISSGSSGGNSATTVITLSSFTGANIQDKLTKLIEYVDTRIQEPMLIDLGSEYINLTYFSANKWENKTVISYANFGASSGFTFNKCKNCNFYFMGYLCSGDITDGVLPDITTTQSIQAGVKITNCQDCEFKFGTIRGFKNGLYLIGNDPAMPLERCSITFKEISQNSYHAINIESMYSSTNGGYGCVKDLVINGGTVHSSACYTTSDGIIMLGNSNSTTGVPTDSFSNIVFNNIYLDFSNDETIGIANYRGNSCTFNNIRATDNIMNGTITGKTIYWEFNSTPEVGTNNRLYFAKPVCRNRLNITVYGKMPQTKVFGTVINAEGTVLGDVYFISSKDGTSKYIKYDAM